MNLAVVLVSDQTIPNVVYLKEIRNRWDKVLFVTTETMERRGKSGIIANAVGNCKFDRLIVDENMIFDVEKKLGEYFSENSYDKVFVNITGGTKIMSLATYTFFKDKPFTENIVYLPIGKTSYKQLYPIGEDGRAADIPITYRMGVREYVKGIGIEAEFESPHDKNLCNAIFDSYFGNEELFSQINSILIPLRDNKRLKKKFKESGGYSILLGLLEKIGVENPEQFDFSKREWIDYFSGGWFEEYVYYALNDACFDDVAINIKIEQKAEDKTAPNEIDVMFTKDNNLYIIECKSGDLEPYQTTEALYKLAQINSHFGLGAKPFFVTLDRNIFDKNGNLRDGVGGRSAVLRIRIVDRKTIKSGISGYFKEIFSCK